MDSTLLELKEALEKLKNDVEKLEFPNEHLTKLDPYNTVFLHSEDLLEFPVRMLHTLELHSSYETNEDDERKIRDIIYTIENSEENLKRIVHSNSTYATPAINAYVISMLYVENILNSIFSLEMLSDNKLLPSAIIRRLKSYNSRIEKIGEETDQIEQKIKIINDAYNAAESLPMTLEQLKEANEEIKSINKLIIKDSENLKALKNKAVEDEKSIEKTKEKLNDYFEETKNDMEEELGKYRSTAEKYIEQCEQAFRMTTTKGLSWSFQEKADKLNNSIRLWVLALIVSLTIAGAVGYYRFIALDNFFLRENVSIFQTIVQVIISIFSLGTPLWFSWLATRQISQRFKLAEDYEFKSSISKAYEGYRREALQLEEDFSQRLFSNALTRLEEPPIRFMSNDIHSTPIADILSSPTIVNAIKKGGDNVDAFLERAGLIKKTNSNAKETINNIKKTAEEAPEIESETEIKQ
ncbi:hypothetical protein [Providencia phage PSTCR8lys]|nr:hypothetical protein [Providencia phage PSTCR8lys]